MSYFPWYISTILEVKLVNFSFWAAKLKQVLQTEVYGKIFAIIPLQIEKEELNMAVVGEKSVSIKNLKLIFVLRYF